MKKNILILLLALFALNSCKDVIGLDSNVDKDLLVKKLSPSDSLSFLDIQNLDFGNVKLGTVNHNYVTIINNSVKDTVTIYSITPKNMSGLYTYTYSKGLPFKIYPGETYRFNRKDSSTIFCR